MRAAHPADATVDVLDRFVLERGRARRFIRCDNGPGLTANALRDWRRFSRAGLAYIGLGSPWQNPHVQSFGSRVRDELLGVEPFSCLAEAQVLIEDWRQDYNAHRPHSALGTTAPTEFATEHEAYLHALAGGPHSRYGRAPPAGDTPTLHPTRSRTDRAARSRRAPSGRARAQAEGNAVVEAPAVYHVKRSYGVGRSRFHHHLVAVNARRPASHSRRPRRVVPAGDNHLVQRAASACR